MKDYSRLFVITMTVGALTSLSQTVSAQGSECQGLPSHAELQATLRTAAFSGVVAANNRGFGNHMWGTIVNRDGDVCAVAFTGSARGDQWPGSRAISAQKANTANAFNLDGLAISTANLYPLVQPGASLFGLQESNPVDVGVAYSESAGNYGQHNDPMVGRKTGGVNVFGGGLALYSGGQVIGALGVSGDTSCADHTIAWEMRKALALNGTPNSDNISYGAGAHPLCFGTETPPL